MGKTKIDEIIKKIDALTQNKNALIKSLEERSEEAKKAIEAAEVRQTIAMTKIDTDGYAQAAQDKAAAESALELFTRKIEELNKNDLVSDEEHEQTIRYLTSYEDSLDADFIKEAKELMKGLLAVYNKYTGYFRLAEGTRERWLKEIHPDYEAIEMNPNLVYSPRQMTIQATAVRRLLAGSNLVEHNLIN